MADPVSAIVDQYKQWLLGATKPRTLVVPKTKFEEHPDRNYSLKNRKASYLQHEKQTFGINLGWTDDAKDSTGDKVARWFFTRSGNNPGPVQYGETIAIGNGGKPSFLEFEDRAVGINLGWSENPSFEWKLLGGKIGDPVNTQDLIAIFNEKSEDGECLIFFDRTVGGDIGWPSSKTWTKQLEGKAWSVVKKQALERLGID